MADGRIEIEITGDGSELQRVIEELQNQAESASDKAKEAAEKAAADAEKAANKSAESATKSISKSVSEATGNFSDMSGKASSVFSSLSSGTQKVGDALTKYITKPATAAAGALGTVVLAKGWSRMTEIDEAKVKLEAIGNTAEDVAEIMDNATASVKGTAYGLDEAATLSATAVAAGIEPGKELTEYLTAIGDTAAVAGTDLSEMGDIFNKITTRGKASMVNLSEFTIRGIDVYGYLGDTLGKTAEEIESMARRGEISMSDLQVAIEEHIGGAAKTIGSSTITGAIENIWASVGRIGANFLGSADDASSFAGQVLPLLNEFMDSLEDVEGWAKDVGSTFGEVFGAIVDYIRNGEANTASMSSAARDLYNKCVPFVDLLKSIGSFWDSLNDSQKTALTATAILAGPAVKALSKIFSVCSKVSGGVSKVAGAISNLTGGMSKATASAETMAAGEAAAATEAGTLAAGEAAATAATTAQTVATKALNVAMKAGPMIAIAAIIALIGDLVGKFTDWQEHTDKMKQATEGLTDAVGQMGDAYDGTAATFDEAGGSVESLSDRVDELTDKQIELAESSSDTWGEVGTNAALVDQYAQTIADLADKSNLTSDEQAQLKTAVDGFNDVCGTSIGIIDGENGKLDESVDAIGRAAEAYKEYAKVQAAQEYLEDVQKQQIENTQLLTEAEQDLSEADKGVGIWIGDFPVYADATSQAYHDLEGNVSDLKDQQDALARAEEYGTQVLADNMGAVNTGVDALQDFADGNKAIQSAAEKSGADVDDLCQKLSNVGVSTKDLSGLTDSELGKLVESYDGTMTSVSDVCDQLGIELGEAADGIEASGEEVKKTYPSSIAEAVAQAESIAGSGATSVADSAATGLDTLSPKAQQAAQSGVQSYTDTVGSANASPQGQSLANTAKSGMASVSANSTGQNFIQGFINGAEAQRSALASMASNLANNALNAMKSALKIGSPSKVTKQYGKWFTQGFAIGITNADKDVTRATVKMVEKGLSALSGATLKATTKSASTYVATASIQAMTEQTQALQKSVNDAFDKAFKKLKTYKGTDFSVYTKNVMDTFTKQLEKASKKSTKKVTNTVNNVVKKATKAAEKAAGKDTKLTKAYEKLGKKAINAYEKAATKEIEKATEKLEKKLTEIADAAQEAIDDVMERQQQLYDTLTDTISMFRTTSGGNVKLLDMDEQMEDMDRYMDLLEQIQKAGASTSVVAYITEQDLDTGTKLMEELLSLSDSEMKSYFSMYDKLYAQAAKVSEDFYADEVQAIQDKYTKQVKKAFNSLKKDMKDIGKNVASAFADGLTKNTKTATKAAKKMAKQVVKAVKKELGIHSPSKVFAELAEMSVQGYTDEMSDSSKQVVRSVSEAFAKVATVSAPEIEVGFSVDTVSLKKMSEEATAMLGAVSTAAVVHNEAVLGSTVTSSIEEQTRELTDRCDELAGTLTEILEATKAERRIDIDHRGLARFVREV